MGTLQVKIVPTAPGNITVRVFTPQYPPPPTPIDETFTVNINNPLDKTWTLDPGRYATSLNWDGGYHNISSGSTGLIVINGVQQYFQAAGTSVLAIVECRVGFSGVIKDGAVVSFQCVGATYNPSHVWLDGQTGNGSVILMPNTHDYSGTLWRARVVIEGSDIFRFECLGSNYNPEHVLLNGWTADGSVNLAPLRSMKTPGVQWDVKETYNAADGYKYNLKCMGPSDPSYLYLDGKTGDGSVRLAPGTDPPYSGAYWKFLV